MTPKFCSLPHSYHELLILKTIHPFEHRSIVLKKPLLKMPILPILIIYTYLLLVWVGVCLCVLNKLQKGLNRSGPIRFSLKRQTGYVRELNGVCSVVDNFFRIHLKHIKLFKDLKSWVWEYSQHSKSYFWMYTFTEFFFKLLNSDDKKCKQNSTVN